jgi:histidinol-phosphatase (PHP family)
MIFDSHTHTEFSADSEMKAEDALAAAEKQGIGLVFTEHLDVDFPGDEDYTFDPQEYLRRYEKLRASGVRLGIEVGMQLSTAEASRAFVRQAPFDLVIGSIHLLDGKDLYYPEAFEGREKAEFYHYYLETMRKNIQAHPFIQVLGHIDYICRYAPYPDPELLYGEFAAEIDAVLREIIDRGIVLELNTRRLGSRRALKALAQILARYRQLGGQSVTIGSDAHEAGAIGSHFSAAVELAHAMGLSLVTFSGGRMTAAEVE